MFSKLILIFILLNIKLFAYDELYFLPIDKKKSINKIINLIQKSKYSIDIAIYNINYKKIIKQLNIASKKGVKINIFYTKKDGNFDKNILLTKTNRKLHTKIAIFDKKIVVFGSANWKKKTFHQNYEVINITDDKIKVQKFNNFFEQVKKEN